MNLTDAEREMFRLMKPGNPVMVDDIIHAIGGNTDRKSMIVRVKYFSAKMAPLGWIVHRESGIGRGAKACYRMSKEF